MLLWQPLTLSAPSEDAVVTSLCLGNYSSKHFTDIVIIRVNVPPIRHRGSARLEQGPQSQEVLGQSPTPRFPRGTSFVGVLLPLDWTASPRQTLSGRPQRKASPPTKDADSSPRTRPDSVPRMSARGGGQRSIIEVFMPPNKQKLERCRFPGINAPSA